ncbi:MAG: hypothetical protein L0211_24400, partial [Planctomycetaceae bacterium]|nr:hypothetical protein [Planctomycetaceae bacterium]
AMFHLAGAPLLRQTFSVLVTLQRAGSAPTTNVAAEPRNVQYEVLSEESGLPEQVTFRDYVIAAAAYLVNGVAVAPREGDEFTEPIDGTNQTFTALPIDKRPAAHPEDPSGKRWIIHTKRTA